MQIISYNFSKAYSDQFTESLIIIFLGDNVYSGTCELLIHVPHLLHVVILAAATAAAAAAASATGPWQHGLPRLQPVRRLLPTILPAATGRGRPAS